MTTAASPLTLNSLLNRSTTGRAIAGVLSDPKRFWIIMLLIYLSLVPVFELFRGARSEPHSDVKLFQRTIENIWHGKMPYRDFEYGYPPYSIPFFIIPSLFKSLKGFQIAFGIQILLIDLLVKGILIWMAVGLSRESSPCPRLSVSPSPVPPAATPTFQKSKYPTTQHSLGHFLPVLLFSIATAANHYFYLQRYYLIPVALTLGVLAAWWKERYRLAGLLLMASIGCNIYPILFVPPLWIAAFRLKQARLFTLGMMLGALPLLLLGLALPWWNSLAFHAGRGLQCESLYASVIWFLHQLGLCEASWTPTKAWMDVTGPSASAVLPYAKCLFLAMTTFTLAYTTWWTWHGQKKLDARGVACILLMVMLPFVAFNTVFNPQYLVWLAVFAALLSQTRGRFLFVLIIMTAVMTPIIYHETNYGGGLHLEEAGILLLRSFTLVLVSVLMLRHWVKRNPENDVPSSTDPLEANNCQSVGR